jgi:predicted Zn-dependent protease
MRKIIFIFLSIILITQTYSLYGQGRPGIQGGANDPFSVMDNIINREEETPTPEGEYYLGRAVAANILTAYKPYVSNIALISYLNNICQVLVINSSLQETYNGYYVTILDSQEYNAFATPGGHIFVTKGLVEAVSSEDALAGIIAHELSHIMLRHGMKIINEMKLYSELDSLAQQSAAIAGSGNEETQRNLAFRNSISELLDIMLKSGYSQAQEFEADDTAVVLLSGAGYDPRGLLEALEVLQKAQRGQQGGLFSTHPAPSERISNTQRRTTGMVSPNAQPARKERFARIMGRR